VQIGGHARRRREPFVALVAVAQVAPLALAPIRAGQVDALCVRVAAIQQTVRALVDVLAPLQHSPFARLDPLHGALPVESLLLLLMGADSGLIGRRRAVVVVDVVVVVDADHCRRPVSGRRRPVHLDDQARQGRRLEARPASALKRAGQIVTNGRFRVAVVEMGRRALVNVGAGMLAVAVIMLLSTLLV
jgi:hypothetical protein